MFGLGRRWRARRQARRLSILLLWPEGGVTGLALGAAVIAAVAALAVFLVRPGAPAETVTGVFVGAHAAETEEGTRIYARVWVDGQHVLAAMPRGLLCAPGDRIVLNRRRGWAGARYSVGLTGCRRGD